MESQGHIWVPSHSIRSSAFTPNVTADYLYIPGENPSSQIAVLFPMMTILSVGPLTAR